MCVCVCVCVCLLFPQTFLSCFFYFSRFLSFHVSGFVCVCVCVCMCVCVTVCVCVCVVFIFVCLVLLMSLSVPFVSSLLPCLSRLLVFISFPLSPSICGLGYFRMSFIPLLIYISCTFFNPSFCIDNFPPIVLSRYLTTLSWYISFLLPSCLPLF